jgi:hypothetical protein
VKPTCVMFFLSVEDVEYCVMFKPEQCRTLLIDRHELIGWDITVAKFNTETVLDQQGCEFWFMADAPTIGDAKTFLRMSLPSLTAAV